MQQIINFASIFILIATLSLFIFKGGQKIRGLMPVSLFTFATILFTSGLDAGLLMLPLTEFPSYKEGKVYQFTNPAAIEFGFWGFLVWTFYFLTTYYFIKIEPVIKLFEIKWVNILNSLVIIATCAFTSGLFLQNLTGYYLTDLSKLQSYMIVFIVIAFSVYSSTRLTFIKVFSVGSTFLFLALIFGMWLNSGIGISGFVNNVIAVFDYFPNIHHFVKPVNDYHEFYIMWWFCWSIMIGQFVARFTTEINVRTLLVSMLVIPSILLAIWFAVIYGYFVDGIKISASWNLAMVVVGIFFVANSLDSLIRLYTSSLNIQVEKLGMTKYMLINLVLMIGLTAMYQLPEDIFSTIKYVGMGVLFIYALAIGRIIMQWSGFRQVQSV